MFDHDLDQSLVILFGLLGAMFILPFVMAWLEQSLDVSSKVTKATRGSWISAPWSAVSQRLAQRRRR